MFEIECLYFLKLFLFFLIDWIFLCKPGAQTQWGPKGGGPKGGLSKISRFFFPLPPQNSFFFFPLWGSSRGILVVFLKAGALKCAHLEFSPGGPEAKVGLAKVGLAKVGHDRPSSLWVLGSFPPSWSPSS